MEAANSKTLMSSIAQMTIGTVPPVTTTSMARQATATITSSSAAAAGGQPGTQAGPTDANPPATQPAAQLKPLRYAPTSTGFPVPSGRIPALLGDVPLSVPPVCAVDGSPVLRRNSCSGEHHLIGLGDRTVLPFRTR